MTNSAVEEQRDVYLSTVTLDVTNKHLKDVPKTLKNFRNIEFLYLSTNDIKTIPDDFFHNLPYLKWLDFRFNKLIKLPKTIGHHRNLRTLLLQGNQITELPIELGNIPTLTGLNISNNPISYPPSTVIEEGVNSVLKFLRQQLHSCNILIPELTKKVEDVRVSEQEGYLGRTSYLNNHDSNLNNKNTTRSQCRSQTPRFQYTGPTRKTNDNVRGGSGWGTKLSPQVSPWANDRWGDTRPHPLGRTLTPGSKSGSQASLQLNSIYLNCEDRSKSSLNLLLPKKTPQFVRSRSMLNICRPPQLKSRGLKYDPKSYTQKDKYTE